MGIYRTDGIELVGHSVSVPAACDLSVPLHRLHAAWGTAKDGFASAAVHPDGSSVALCGSVRGLGWVWRVTSSGEVAAQMDLQRLIGWIGETMVAQQVCFDRSGDRLWISFDGQTRGALAILDSRTLEALDWITMERLLASHQMLLREEDDTLILSLVSGEADATFVRVATMRGANIRLLPQAMSDGVDICVLAGFTDDRRHLVTVSDYDVALRSWPTLEVVRRSPRLDSDCEAHGYDPMIVGGDVLVGVEDQQTGARRIEALHPPTLRRRGTVRDTAVASMQCALPGQRFLSFEHRGRAEAAVVWRYVPGENVGPYR